jgi:biopolymer transport protein ExbD
MINHSVLSQTAMTSQLASSSVIAPKGKSWKRSLAADLLLTALVDAFSILVIFLLMSFSSTGDLLLIGKDTELPKAAQTELLERAPVVKVEQGQIYLENKPVTGDSLIQALLDLRKKFAADHAGEEYPGMVTVQADRRVKYEFLNQIVLACAHAGFSDIRFAVLVK